MYKHKWIVEIEQIRIWNINTICDTFKLKRGPYAYCILVIPSGYIFVKMYAS